LSCWRRRWRQQPTVAGLLIEGGRVTIRSRAMLR
jgi:hypothetical protein